MSGTESKCRNNRDIAPLESMKQNKKNKQQLSLSDSNASLEEKGAGSLKVHASSRGSEVKRRDWVLRARIGQALQYTAALGVRVMQFKA